MGAKSRSAAKEKRKKQKKARKEAMRAQYEAWTKAGQNKKSQRARQRAKKSRVVSDFSHPTGACGNVGCGPCRGETECPRTSLTCHCGRHGW